MKYSIVVIIIVAMVAIALLPIALIWAIDTLSGRSTPLTMTTWFAALLVIVVLGRGK
jgi:hypothetical protein